MKAKNKVIFLLLFIMSLYVTHGLFFANHHESHEHHVAEYLSELQAPSSCDDVCDYHFVFHQVFLLPQPVTLYEEIQANLSPIHKSKPYFFKSLLEFYKPPIS
jgi:hypothetical protein